VSKLPVVSGKQLCKLLEQPGYSIDHQTESHRKEKTPTKTVDEFRDLM